MTLEEKAGMSTLFEPVTLGPLQLPNRVVMAPMSRYRSPEGVPGEDIARYYRRRIEGGVSLIITEGSWVPHPGASDQPNAPRFYGDDALAGWKRVLDEVHAAGGKIMPQLMHRGQTEEGPGGRGARRVGPSGMFGSLGVPLKQVDEPATLRDIEDVIDSFAIAAQSAHQMGFDGIALHGGHGYIIDQFFWSATNLRTDEYGGDIAGRTRFACDLVREVRRRTAPDFPIMMRLSQWKLHDYSARLAQTPQELEAYLLPLVDAGVDIFDFSQRRFWEGEFGTDMNIAGWARKLSGRPSMTVGSVSLTNDMFDSFMGNASNVADNLAELERRLDRGDFDLVAVGRALIADPDWPRKVANGANADIVPFQPAALKELV
ncbi:2,4-dienoyl-CoA reductase [Rhizobium sp. NFR03]|nr:2,4-dienoyl-CoA reductase [Rhizobium sp. NFR03]